MVNDDPTPNEDSLSKLTSEQLAGLIVDALLQAGIVGDSHVRRAIEIAAEEIEARKAVGDY